MNYETYSELRKLEKKYLYELEDVNSAYWMDEIRAEISAYLTGKKTNLDFSEMNRMQEENKIWSTVNFDRVKELVNQIRKHLEIEYVGKGKLEKVDRDSLMQLYMWVVTMFANASIQIGDMNLQWDHNQLFAVDMHLEHTETAIGELRTKIKELEKREKHKIDLDDFL